MKIKTRFIFGGKSIPGHLKHVLTETERKSLWGRVDKPSRTMFHSPLISFPVRDVVWGSAFTKPENGKESGCWANSSL